MRLYTPVCFCVTSYDDTRRIELCIRQSVVRSFVSFARINHFQIQFHFIHSGFLHRHRSLRTRERDDTRIEIPDTRLTRARARKTAIAIVIHETEKSRRKEGRKEFQKFNLHPFHFRDHVRTCCCACACTCATYAAYAASSLVVVVALSSYRLP